MGMAASQARYLALSARKTNVEYEGQQINQSRLLLSNQSADLFNQMLGMEVPTAPSTQDFTIIQYSYSDGNNTSVFSSYQQLGTKDSEYNYVVTAYHYENIYTGSKKLLNDPQVQATATDHYVYDPDINKKTMAVTSAIRTGSDTSTDPYNYSVVTSDGATTIFRPATLENEEKLEAINYGQGKGVVADQTVDLSNAVTKATFSVCTDEDIEAIRTAQSLTASDTIDPEEYYKDENNVFVTKTQYEASASTTGKQFSPNGVDTTVTTKNFAAGTQFYVCDDTDAINLKRAFGNSAVPTDYRKLKNTTDDGYTYYVPKTKVGSDNKLTAATDATRLAIADANAQSMYTDGTTFATKTQLEALIAGTANSIDYMTTTNNPKFSDYKAVGNCDLSAVTTEDYEKEAVKTEIEQIIKDMQKSTGSTTAAENFAKCFDSDGNYVGGIYTFKMGGVTYYTTKSDLDTSLASGYESGATSDNAIDNQSKLAYYNASYLQTKIEETKKALLETDGQGRFTSVRFEDDSVVYTLNVESITDDAAYNDAMNEYNYKQNEYDKEIRDINAKTEMLQAQDRELELRLEQLNTEQSALQNEMEAVKKVVDKHVETGFKTFGG